VTSLPRLLAAVLGLALSFAGLQCSAAPATAAGNPPAVCCAGDEAAAPDQHQDEHAVHVHASHACGASCMTVPDRATAQAPQACAARPQAPFDRAAGGQAPCPDPHPPRIRHA